LPVIYFAGKDATEARDLLDYDILARRIQKLEKVYLLSVANNDKLGLTEFNQIKMTTSFNFITPQRHYFKVSTQKLYV
jgi:hypothetical protein